MVHFENSSIYDYKRKVRSGRSHDITEKGKRGTGMGAMPVK